MHRSIKKSWDRRLMLLKTEIRLLHTAPLCSSGGIVGFSSVWRAKRSKANNLSSVVVILGMVNRRRWPRVPYVYLPRYTSATYDKCRYARGLILRSFSIFLSSSVVHNWTSHDNVFYNYRPRTHIQNRSRYVPHSYFIQFTNITVDSFIIIMFSRSTVSAIRSLTSSSSQAARWTTAASTSYAISNIATSHSSHNTLLNNHQYRCLNVASRPSELIGNTPLLDLNKILVAHGVDGKKIAITNIHIPPDI